MLGRRTSSPAPAPAPPAEPAGPGKGRPTPKRREAERNRRSRVQVPKDRKEAARLARDRGRQERAAARAALMTGDERGLPARDRGPVRRFARDFIDARRSAAEYFLYLALAVFAISLSRAAVLEYVGVLLWLGALLLIAVDSLLLARRLRAQIAARFPDEVARGESRGVVRYALLRSLQIRRLRLPPPRVKPGTRL